MTIVGTLSEPAPVVVAEHGVMAAPVYVNEAPVQEIDVIVGAAVIANVPDPVAAP